jgi:putative phage-type endonuclease
MIPNVLAQTKDMSREEWLKFRNKGIGGSDASVILGFNKYKSPLQLFLEKTGQIEPEEAGESAYWGNVLEDVVAKEFSIRTRLKVKRKNAILQHPEYPFILANVDRLIVGERTGLECKTASEYLKGEWVDDEIPAQYLIQCQHYMLATGYQSWWIAVLIGGNKFIYKKIERDEEIIHYLIQEEKNFWENHVLANIPPMVDGSEASTNLLKSLYPTAIEGTEINLPLESDTIIQELEETKAELKIAKKRVSELENRLKEMLKDHETGFSSNHIITWEKVVRTDLDKKLLKSEMPDVYEKFEKKSSYRRLGIKKVK